MATAYRVIKNLAKKHKVLGYGYYSVVFGLDEYEVVKVGSTLRDPCYYYLQQCRHWKNKHFPKVYSIYTDVERDFYVARVERLEHLSSIERNTIADFSSLVRTKKFKDVQDIELAAALSKLYDLYASDESIDVDLHSNNILKRQKTLVLNDPFCEVDILTEEYTFEDWMQDFVCT